MFLIVKDGNKYKLGVKHYGVEYYKYIKPAEGYIQLEYLTCNGAQRILTGVTPSLPGAKIEMRVKFNNTSKNQCLWCSRTALRNNAFSCTLVSRVFRFDYYNTQNNTIEANTTDIFTVTLDDNTGYVNGNQVWQGTAQTFTPPTELELFVTYENGVNSTLSNWAYYDFYSCKIWQNNVLQRDFVPVVRTSDNEVGLFDKVNNTYYANQGSGTFTASQYWAVEEGTENDYDFKRDINKYYALRRK